MKSLTESGSIPVTVFCGGSGSVRTRDPEEAVTLAAVIDLHRRSLFRASADNTDFHPKKFNTATIASTIETTGKSFQWLVWTLKLLCSVGSDPSVYVVPALGRLVSSGNLIQDGELFRLAPEGALLAERLLIVDSILSIRAGRIVPPDTYIRLNFVCLQAGLHDILSIEPVSGRLRFECLSSTAVMEYIRYILIEPEALSIAEKLLQITCRSCNAAVPEGNKFCRKCGTLVEVVTPSGFYPKYGAELF